VRTKIAGLMMKCSLDSVVAWTSALILVLVVLGWTGADVTRADPGIPAPWISIGPSTAVDAQSLLAGAPSAGHVWAGTFYNGLYHLPGTERPWGRALSAGIAVLAADPHNPNTIFAGTWIDGIFRSQDGGSTWAQITTGLTAGSVLALALDPGTSRHLYAGTDVGLYRSTDNGDHWAAVPTWPA